MTELLMVGFGCAVLGAFVLASRGRRGLRVAVALACFAVLPAVLWAKLAPLARQGFDFPMPGYWPHYKSLYDLRVPLASERTFEWEPAVDRLFVDLDSDGRLYARLLPTSLLELRRHLDGLPPEARVAVVLRADKDAPWESVARLLFAVPDRFPVWFAADRYGFFFRTHEEAAEVGEREPYRRWRPEGELRLARKRGALRPVRIEVAATTREWYGRGANRRIVRLPSRVRFVDGKRSTGDVAELERWARERDFDGVAAATTVQWKFVVAAANAIVKAGRREIDFGRPPPPSPEIEAANYLPYPERG